MQQFLLASNCGDYKKVLQDGKVQHDLEGPWCDIWSLGIIILQTVLGSHSKGPYINEVLVSYTTTTVISMADSEV